MDSDKKARKYVGRFAPSPTGPLHFGSLLAAVASYLEARTQGGLWLLRIEDIDPPREEAGATDSILRSLEGYGFEWDGPVLFQSRNCDHHDAAVEALLAAGHAYLCGCSRATLRRSARRGTMGYIYPGTCRDGARGGASAVRIRTSGMPVSVTDRIQGEIRQCLETEVGDFVIRRRDGLIAYQLAVVLDDAADGITDIVRGIDLLDSTPRQVFLQQLLGLPTPSYMHIPIAVDARGDKLSKQTAAPAVSLTERSQTLVRALRSLRQDVPAALADGPVDRIWEWALENWRPESLYHVTRVTAI